MELHGIIISLLLSLSVSFTGNFSTRAAAIPSPTVNEPARYQGKMPTLLHAGKMPTLLHAGKMPTLLHAGKMATLLHAGKMATLLHAGKMPFTGGLKSTLQNDLDLSIFGPHRCGPRGRPPPSSNPYKHGTCENIAGPRKRTRILEDLAFSDKDANNCHILPAVIRDRSPTRAPCTHGRRGRAKKRTSLALRASQGLAQNGSKVTAGRTANQPTIPRKKSKGNSCHASPSRSWRP